MLFFLEPPEDLVFLAVDFEALFGVVFEVVLEVVFVVDFWAFNGVLRPLLLPGDLKIKQSFSSTGVK